MAKFKKKGGKGTPAISTASLPDIIFMLLFFFMVTTTMREATLLVKIKPPEATEVQKLEKKSLVDYIYIGPPMKKKLGTDSRIQLNDQFATDIRDIREFVERGRAQRDEADRKLITISLKVDKETKMGIVTDVKQELREVGAFKINYSTAKKRDLAKR
ncbi:MAG: biopolymer transporter ExbD [Bacteroidales bacterium]|nr:biopolymer transporter ExbD [Bacteroidales bacterium]